jgi:nucleoid DNA-binding protein
MTIYLRTFPKNFTIKPGKLRDFPSFSRKSREKRGGGNISTNKSINIGQLNTRSF